jgi:hypothetical protein
MQMQSIVRRISFIVAVLTSSNLPSLPVEAQSGQKDYQMNKTASGTIHGYNYGSPELKKSPVTVEELKLLKETLLWSEDDDRYLKMAGDVLEKQVDDILDTWYGYVGANKHLVSYFSNERGEPDGEYLETVRKRFGKWILDTCRKPYDQHWLDYQYEIGLRHHTSKKNKTDEADAVDIVHQRYLTAFIYPITVTIRPFLEKGSHSEEDVDGMYNAWFKSVTLQVILWSYPYINEGEF